MYSTSSTKRKADDTPTCNKRRCLSQPSTNDRSPGHFSKLPAEIIGEIGQHLRPKEVVTLKAIDRRTRQLVQASEEHIAAAIIQQQRHRLDKEAKRLDFEGVTLDDAMRRWTADFGCLWKKTSDSWTVDLLFCQSYMKANPHLRGKVDDIDVSEMIVCLLDVSRWFESRIYQPEMWFSPDQWGRLMSDIWDDRHVLVEVRYGNLARLLPSKLGRSANMMSHDDLVQLLDRIKKSPLSGISGHPPPSSAHSIEWLVIGPMEGRIAHVNNMPISVEVTPRFYRWPFDAWLRFDRTPPVCRDGVPGLTDDIISQKERKDNAAWHLLWLPDVPESHETASSLSRPPVLNLAGSMELAALLQSAQVSFRFKYGIQP